jgi:hypothetical protein
MLRSNRMSLARSSSWLTLVIMRLGDTKRVLSTALCVAALVGCKPKEPSFGGQPLGFWFHELPLTGPGPASVPGMPIGTSNSVPTMATFTAVGVFGGTYGVQRVKPGDSIAAVRGLGTKALPFLVWKLSRPSLPLRRQIEALGFRCRIKEALFVNRELERAQAVTGLLALPALPQSTVEQIRKLSRHPNVDIARSARIVIQSHTRVGMKEAIQEWQ